MSRRPRKNNGQVEPMARRAWLRRALLGVPALAGMIRTTALARAAQEKTRTPADAEKKTRTPADAQKKTLTPAEEAENELKRAKARVSAVTNQPVRIERSRSYQAVGDASQAFMKLTLNDCELITLDYLDYYRSKGFELRRPDRPLTLVVLFDERPFKKLIPNAPPFVDGVYKPGDNWLVRFDFRNVRARSARAGPTNMTNLAHEATHLLAFNTGLLNRRGDTPWAIVEGIATYGEVRRLHGRSEPGKINSRRLDQLAHVQRKLKWIGLSELLTYDATTLFKSADLTELAYAESWLLVYHLMTTPARLPQFRAYLKAIYPRLDKSHRLEDAATHFGSLERLDQELRREAIRLQQAR